MNFDKQTTAPCVIPAVPRPDPRCLDATYALAHPEECGSALIIKPSFVTLCNLASQQFAVFDLRNGFEVPITTGLAFTSSTPAVFTLGVNSGSGTALSVGEAVIHVVSLDGRTASAAVTVLAEDTCCDDVEVATAIVLDISNSSRLPFGGSYSTRLDFAKAMAKHYSDPILEVGSVPKDSISLWTLDVEAVDVMPGLSTDSAEIAAAIDTIQQTTKKTDLLLLFTHITEELIAET